MHRLAVSLSAFALIFVMMVNIALFVQNNQLRKQASAAPPQPTQAAVSRRARADRSTPAGAGALRAGSSSSHPRCHQRAQPANPAPVRRTGARHIQKPGSVASAGKSAAEGPGRQPANDEHDQQSGRAAPWPDAVDKRAARFHRNHQQLRDYFTGTLNREWSPEAEQQERAVMQALDMDAGNTDMRQIADR